MIIRLGGNFFFPLLMACAVVLSSVLQTCSAAETWVGNVISKPTTRCINNNVTEAEVDSFLMELKTLLSDDRMLERVFYEKEIFRNFLPMQNPYGEDVDQRVSVRATGVAYANYFKIAIPPKSEDNLSLLDKISADVVAMWSSDGVNEPRGYISFLLREDMLPFAKFSSALGLDCSRFDSMSPHPFPAATGPNGSIECLINFSKARQHKTVYVNTYPNGAVHQIAIKSSNDSKGMPFRP